MKSIGIIGTGSYVAPKVMTNQDWLRYVETSDEWIFTKTGIKERRIAEPNVATSDLAVEAAKKALSDANIRVGEVDVIVLEAFDASGASYLTSRSVAYVAGRL